MNKCSVEKSQIGSIHGFPWRRKFLTQSLERCQILWESMRPWAKVWTPTAVIAETLYDYRIIFGEEKPKANVAAHWIASCNTSSAEIDLKKYVLNLMADSAAWNPEDCKTFHWLEHRLKHNISIAALAMNTHIPPKHCPYASRLYQEVEGSGLSQWTPKVRQGKLIEPLCAISSRATKRSSMSIVVSMEKSHWRNIQTLDWISTAKAVDQMLRHKTQRKLNEHLCHRSITNTWRLMENFKVPLYSVGLS